MAPQRRSRDIAAGKQAGVGWGGRERSSDRRVC